MTLRELKNEVCALGFDDYARLDTALLFSARRALAAIYSECRITERAKFFVASRVPTSRVARLHHTGGGAEALPLSGKAYAMTVSGEGTVKIRDGAESMKIDFNSDSKLIRGFLRYGGQATFEGESSFDVYDIATYGELYGRDVDSIPDGGDEIRIDLREKLGDFLAFASVAETADGTAIKNAVLRDGVITLPVTFSGEVLLTYRRMPKMPNLSYPDAAIDIPREYESLLPLLTAFYILLDDDAEKAEIYERAYRETLASLKINGYAVSNNGYADVSGWGK